MISFILALFFSIAILILFRAFKSYQINTINAIVISYLISAVLSISLSHPNIDNIKIFDNNYILAIILGISFFTGFVFLSLSTQKSGISITSVAANISVIIPVVVASIFYNEKINGAHLAGLLTSIAAVILIFSPNKKKKFNIQLIVFPLAIFIISGLNNSILRQAERNNAFLNPMLFLGIIFSMAFISSLIYALAFKKLKLKKYKDLLFGILLGIANFSATYFFFKSLSIFSSSLFFPIYNMSFIGISSIVGILVFKEKLSKVNITGLIIAIIAVMLMNWR